MITAAQAAKYLCSRSDWSLSNLKLQKILYLAHMTFMGENNGARLISNPFEAWDFGPVVPDLYHRVKIFGSEPIKNVFRIVADVEDADEREILDWAADSLAGMSPAKLVNITHWEDGAWAKHYRPGCKGIIIPDEDILDEYEARGEPE